MSLEGRRKVLVVDAVRMVIENFRSPIGWSIDWLIDCLYIGRSRSYMKHLRLKTSHLSLATSISRPACCTRLSPLEALTTAYRSQTVCLPLDLWPVPGLHRLMIQGWRLPHLLVSITPYHFNKNSLMLTASSFYLCTWLAQLAPSKK